MLICVLSRYDIVCGDGILRLPTFHCSDLASGKAFIALTRFHAHLLSSTASVSPAPRVHHERQRGECPNGRTEKARIKILPEKKTVFCGTA